jgi:pimeloyl-ACP methyl ester carboxylesterase
MKSEIFYADGDREKPLIIFIHGIGMDAAMWAEPALARILGGKYPLSILLDKAEMRTLFHDLKDIGFPVLAWSQKRPAGPAFSAVAELKDLVAAYSLKTSAGIVLIGHSRGGLIARLFLQDSRIPVRGVVTIGTPHRGSSMSKWATSVSPITTIVRSYMDWNNKEVKSALHRVLTFLNSDGIKEMLPGSGFLKSISDERTPGTRIISIGGTDPALIKIGKSSLPSIMSGIMPEIMLPEEMREGKGDGLVSAESAVCPGGDEHRNYHAHHTGLIFNVDVREYIMKVVMSLTG